MILKKTMIIWNIFWHKSNSNNKISCIFIMKRITKILFLILLILFSVFLFVYYLFNKVEPLSIKSDDLIIQGEKIQQLADVYIGLDEDFSYNPLINDQLDKCKDINSIETEYSNPNIVFCYSVRVAILNDKIKHFNNPFVLITHNSDQNINDISKINNILSNKNLIHWYAQNLALDNEKISPLPIGIQNNMWKNCISFYNDENLTDLHKRKSQNVFMNFSINTNAEKRSKCLEILKDKIPFLENIESCDNLKRLSQYKFCICPEGNGYDSHRLWEALYLQTIPIVIDSDFIRIIKKHINPPMVILNDWNDFNEKDLHYDSYNFDGKDYYKKFSFEYYKQLINR